MPNWTTSNIPPQQGRSVVVTGTGGLGFEDALALARAGAEVIIAGRNPQKGAQAIAKIRTEVPAANVSFEQIDLASLKSVADFAARLARKRDSLDLLINNAGIMVPPTRDVTVDGFELQFATNYLSHFALTAHLLPLLQQGRDPRVVTLSSIAVSGGQIDLKNLQSEISYVPGKAYSQSKLACLMFAFELQRRSDANGWGITSMAAHPGVSRTDLLHNGPGRNSVHGLARSLLWFLFQPPAQGALPTLYAATSPDAKPGAYYGPDKISETRGYPALSKVPPQSTDQAVAEQLWQASEHLAKIYFQGGQPAPRLTDA